MKRVYRNYKLSETEDFQRVFKRNKSLQDRYWLVLYRPNGLDHARLGTAVSKKNVSKAVQRNRIKRIIRETFRKNRDDLGMVDVVVLVRRGISEKKNRELNVAITKQWLLLSQESQNKEIPAGIRE